MSEVRDRTYLRSVIPPPDLEPSARRRRRLVGAGVCLAALLGVALWVLVSRTGDANHRQAAPTAVPANAAKPAERNVVATASCPALPERDQTVPRSAPAGVTWSLVDYVAMPFSKTAGPAVVSTTGVASCFADTPVGALIALVQVSDRIVVAPDWRGQIDSGIAPGPGATALIKVAASTPDQAPTPGDTCQAAGFAFLSYTRSAAQIAAVGRCGSNLQVGTYSLVWQAGDWRLQLQPDGSFTPAATTIASLMGYVTWGGV